ncbi:hypothetical protein Pryu01_00854 [Paraliobacillus ryukyuensis]|uniref:O-antigen ligase-like membrane protein n=1 Tax=Paraliobacillus ryukyuensis TaxID=200904 RepID=A0A366EE25_9BACI|nr:O-antigen ligase family protein [Paraliobacillus ryukyuensis]RBP00573.1 O-antigen ligase-like membrane protein [Paraliobacillus ryukyuensis]
MRSFHSKTIQQLESIFILFIVIQPVLDLFAFLNWPISELVRILAIALGVVYLSFHPNERIQSATIIYHIVLFIYIGCHFFVSYLFKQPVSLTIELTHIVKSIFFIELFMVYLSVIYSLSRQRNWQNLLLRNVTISMTIISLVMVLAELTNTGKRSYDMLAKAGHSGWFFSANELSAIMAIGFGLTLLYVFRQKNIQRKLLLGLLLAILTWAMMTIGTKVSFGAALIFLVVGLVSSFFQKQKVLSSSISGILLIACLIWLPFSPIGQNLHLTLGSSSSQSTEADNQVTEETEAGFNRVLSGRSEFLAETIEQYEDAPLAQKWLGMGYGGNYTAQPKLIEMDFIDWFFGFGIIGFLILHIPILYFVVKLITYVLQEKKRVLTIPVVMITVCIGIGFGAALVAGHVLSSPAVSIYLALAMGYLYTLSHPNINQRKVGDHEIYRRENVGH